MRRRKFTRRLSEYISDNKKYYILVASVVFLGIVIGTVSAVTMKSDAYRNLNTYIDNFLSVFNLQPINRIEVFKTSFYSNTKTILFLWLSGLWVGFIPFAILQMGIKGYKIGFSIAFFVQAYRGMGIVFIFLSMIPQLLILLPALMVYTVFNIKYSLSIHKLRDRKNVLSVRKDMYLRNFLCIIGIIFVIILCSFIDSFVISSILKPVCYFLGS